MRYFFIGILIILFGSLGESLWVTAILVAFLLREIWHSYFIAKNWLNPIFFLKLSVLISTLANQKVINLFEAGIHLRSYRYANPALFDTANMLWILGTLAIFWGYESSPRVKLPKVNWQFRSQKALTILFFFSFALSLRSFLFPFRLPGTLDQILYLMPLISILIFARMYGITQRNLFFIYAIILTIFLTGQAVLFAYLRSDMIKPLLVFFLGLLSSKRGLGILNNLKFYPIYAFILIFFALFEAFGSNRANLGSGLGRITQLVQLSNSVSQVNRVNRLSAFERTSTVGQVSAVVELVKQNGYYDGQVSSPLLTALIPRFLWPDKPPIAFGVWFAYEIGAAVKTKTWYNTSINMTIPGNLFIDFGWIGMILGGWLIGGYLRNLWATTQFENAPLNLTGTLFGGYLLYVCFFGFGADLQILVTMLALYLIIWALDRGLHIIFPRSR